MTVWPGRDVTMVREQWPLFELWCFPASPETYRDPSVGKLMLQFIFPNGLKLCINDNSQLFKRLCQAIRPWNELIYLNSRGDGVHSCMANIQINCQWKRSPPIYSPCILLIHKCTPTHIHTHTPRPKYSTRVAGVRKEMPCHLWRHMYTVNRYR